MDFAFVLGNHSQAGIDTLYDIMDTIGGQLIDLGHQVRRHDGALLKNHVNIMIEGFTESFAGFFDGISEHGARLVIIATEQPGKPGFNNSKLPHMIGRQRAFPIVACQADAVWCLVPGVAQWAKRFNPKAADLELGHSMTRQRVCWSEVDPVFDFAFFGSLTPRRKHILDAFAAAGHPVATGATLTGFLPPANRDALVASAKVVLGIDPFPKWRLVSNSRIATALSIGRPILCEPPYARTPWTEVGIFARSHGSFLREAVAMLENWRETRDRQLAIFRSLFSPERCVGAAITATLDGV